MGIQEGSQEELQEGTQEALQEGLTEETQGGLQAALKVKNSATDFRRLTNLSVGIVPPQDKLQFAKWVLKGIFMIFMLSVVMWFYQRPFGQILLDICKIDLLPIATFVISDYFGGRPR